MNLVCLNCASTCTRFSGMVFSKATGTLVNHHFARCARCKAIDDDPEYIEEEITIPTDIETLSHAVIHGPPTHCHVCKQKYALHIDCEENARMIYWAICEPCEIDVRLGHL